MPIFTNVAFPVLARVQADRERLRQGYLATLRLILTVIYPVLIGIAAVAPIAVPLIFGETGPSYDDSDCGSATVSKFLQWADVHNVGYEAWTWDTWDTCNSLISDYAGTPRTAYGAWIKWYYAKKAGSTHGPRR